MPAASGRDIRVVIGPVIDSRDKTAEELRQQVESWIEGTMTQIQGKPSVRVES